MTPGFLKSILLSAAVCLLPAALGAQEEPPPDPETFSETVDVHVVNVEVVVTDNDGQPVEGLTREDFEIYEDDQRMAVSNFYAADGNPSQPARVLGEEAPASETAEDLPPDGTRYLRLVIFVDNLNIRPQNRKMLFDQLRQYLRETEGPKRRLSVVSMNSRMEIELPFTEDLGQVHEALARVEKAMTFESLYDGERRMLTSRLQNASLRRYSPRRTADGSVVEGQEGDVAFEDAVRVALEMVGNIRILAERRTQKVLASIQAMTQLSDSLGGLPGRKALLYLSDGLPQRPADSLIESFTSKYDTWLAQNESDIRENSRYPEAPDEFRDLMQGFIRGDFDLRKDVDEMARRASASQVTFYPISGTGRTSGYLSAAQVGTGVVTSTGGMSRNAQVTENFSRDATLLQMAEDTGGVALLRSTNLPQLLGQVQRDFDSFYSLGYSPPHGGQDHKYHELKIKVLRPGLKVRHPEGYRNKNWRQRLGEMTLAAALYGVESNPLGVQLAASGEVTQKGKRFRLPLLIKIPFELIRMIHQDEHFNAQLTALVLVHDEDDGGLSQARRFDFPIKVPDSRVLEAMAQVATYPLELEINKGRKRIVVGIRDHLSQIAATVTYDVTLGES